MRWTVALAILAVTILAARAGVGPRGATRPAALGPAHLELVAHLASAVRGAAVDGDTAVLATDAGFTVGELDDPDRPRTVGLVTVADGWTQGVAVAGRLAYGIVAPERLAVLDLADRAKPRTLATLSLGAPIQSVTASDDLALVALGPTGLAVVDGAEPAGPRVVGTLGTHCLTRRALRAGRFAYLAERDAFESLVRVVDLADPRAPREVATVDVPGGADWLALTGDDLLVAGPTSALTWLDVTDPLRPRAVAVGTTPCLRQRGLAAAGRALYVACDEALSPRLLLMDLAAPEPFALASSLALPAVPQDLAAGGNWLAVALADAGVQLYRVTEPFAARRVEWSVTVGGSSTDLALAAGHLYAVGHGHLETVDVTVPGDPRPVHVDLPGGDLWDLALRPGQPELLIAGRPRTSLDCFGNGGCSDLPFGPGLRRGRLQPPEAPQLHGMEEDLAVSAVAVEGDLAVAVVERSYARAGAAVGWGGVLGAFALTGAAAAPRPLSAASFVPPIVLYGDPAEVVLSGGIAYVVGAGFLQVFDVRDPARVRHVTTVADAALAGARTVAVVGRRLAVGTPRSLVLLDLSVPLQPVVTAALPVADGVDHVAGDGEVLVALVGDRRAQLWDIGTPGAPVLADELALAPAAMPAPEPRRCPHDRRNCLPGPGVPRVTVAGRRAFVHLPGAGMLELALASGARPTVPSTTVPATGTPPIASTPVTATGTPRPPTATGRPPAWVLHLPFAGSG